MNPYLSWADRAEIAGRMIIPYSVMIGLFFINLVSVPYPLSAVFSAPYVIMMIYYWAVYRPTMLPPWLLFIAGLVFDALSGFIFGLHAALFVVFRLAVVDQRRFLTGQGFTMLWLGFSLASTIYHLVQWGLYSLLTLTILPLKDIGLPLILGVVLFPVIYLVMNLTHKLLPFESPKGRSALASQN